MIHRFRLAFLVPARDGLFLLLPSPALWFLSAPAHLSQDRPDMTGRILNPKGGFDRLGDAGQGPLVGGKACGTGPPKQDGFFCSGERRGGRPG